MVHSYDYDDGQILLLSAKQGIKFLLSFDDGI